MRFKRGMAEGSFKWIFVLLAGGLFFFLFINFYNNYKATSEQQSLVDITAKLTNILSNAQSNPNSVFELTAKDAYLTYTDCNSGLHLNGNRNMPVRLGTLFAPDEIKSKSDRILLWILPFEFPFRVTNFLFVTSPEVHYVFLNNTDSAENLIDDLVSNDKTAFPDQFTYTVVDYSGSPIPVIENMKNRNYYNTKFVVSKADFPDENFNIIMDKSFKQYDAELLRIEKNALDFYGSLEFFTMYKDGGDYKFSTDAKTESRFFDRSTLFGAVVSDDMNLYECAVKKAFQRYKYQLEIYEKRSDQIDYRMLYLFDEGEDMSCDIMTGIYPSAIGTIDYITTHYVGDAYGGIISRDPFSGLDDRLASNLYYDVFETQVSGDSGVFSLKDLNTYAISKTCPLIY